MTISSVLYHPSGNVSPFFFLTLPIMLIPVFLMSYLYSVIVIYNPFVYLNILLFLGYCLVLGLLSTLLVKLAKSRNLAMTVVFGLLTGVWALYSAWLTFIYQLADGALFLADLAGDPAFLWQAIQKVGATGWYEIIGFTPSGWVIWPFWLIEAVGLVGTPVVVAHGFGTSNVYCEPCNAWADEDEGVLTFAHPDAEVLKSQFGAQDLAFLKAATPVGETDESFFRIDAEWCKKCGETLTLSLRLITRSWDNEGKESTSTETLFEDLLVSKTTFDAVMNAKLSPAGS